MSPKTVEEFEEAARHFIPGAVIEENATMKALRENAPIIHEEAPRFYLITAQGTRTPIKEGLARLNLQHLQEQLANPPQGDLYESRNGKLHRYATPEELSEWEEGSIEG